MPTINEYLTENARYIDPDSAARIKGFTPAMWAACLAATLELTGAAEPGIECRVVTTSETIADFDKSRREHWSERGSRETFEFAGLPAVKFSDMQISRGRQRLTQIVIDAGDIRICLI